MGTIKTTNIEPIADNGTVTLGSSGDQFTLATGAKSSFLYPAFEAYLNTSQTVSDSATTKVPFEVEVFDTDNCYDNSTNYRFTPTVAGKYYVYASVMQDGGPGLSNTYSQTIFIYKNGSEYKKSHIQYQGNPIRQSIIFNESVIDMNGSSDYLEIYQSLNTDNGNDGVVEPDSTFKKATSFGAYRIGS